MKFLTLLKGEIKASLTTLPLVVLFIVLCLSAVIAALPLNMLQRGEDITNLRIAISTPEHDDIFNQVTSFMKMEKHIADVQLVEPIKGKQLINEGKVDFYLEFPENFDDALFEHEEATIKMRSSNPILGSIAYQIMDSAISSLNSMQGSSLTYYEALKDTDYTYKERSDLSRTFDLRLIQLALLRDNAIKIKDGVNQYFLQILSLILFISTSIIVCYYALVVTRQEKNQVFRKLLLYRYSLGQIWLSKLLICLLLTIPVILLSILICKGLQLPLHLPQLIIGEIFLMILLYAIAFTATALMGENKNTSSVLLVNFVILFLFMILGGLIYPSYSQQFHFTTGNPAWLAQLIAESTIKGDTPTLSTLPIYLLTVVICCFVTIKCWRRRL